MSDYKPRKLVYKQAKNQLQQIADLFIASILHYRRPEESTVAFLERVFCVGTRFIVQCELRAGGYINGKEVLPGERVFVRHDTTKPDLYEIERVKDTGPILRMSAAEWCLARKAMKPVDKNTDGNRVLFGAVR